MSITQNISEITPLSAFTSPNRPAEVDNLVENELPNLTQELGLLIPQINETTYQASLAAQNTEASKNIATTQAGIATTKASEANTSANQALTYKNQVMGYVVPSGASYSVGQLNTKYSAMTKAQFNALAEERKANRVGSGFDNFGSNYTGVNNIYNVNQGLNTLNVSDNMPNSLLFSVEDITSSKTSDGYPFALISGVRQKLKSIGANYNKILLPTAPTIYPHDTVLTTEQIASGVIKHADASNSGLIVNGKFDTDTSGWLNNFPNDVSITLENNRIRLTELTSLKKWVHQGLNLIVGKKYIFEADVYTTVPIQIGLFSNPLTGSLYSSIFTSSINSKVRVEFTARYSVEYLALQSFSGSINSYAEFDNIAVYPADAISRSDLVFLESFHEDISEKNFVYPLGNVQYLGADTDGLTGIANGAFTGFETYSLFGNWQTPSALIGKGYIWSNLTESQKRAFISNPENNCYLDGDKIIQVRYRIRVVQGAGDNWFNVDTQSVPSLAYSTTLYVQSKGKNSNISSDLSVGTSYFNSGKNNIRESGVWIAFNTSHGYDGKCFALPIALVHRKNQGMYHSVYNPNGTKKASDNNFWYNTAVSFTSISACFDPSKLLTASGYIGTVSGRPDGLFYDQISENSILDLRNSSKKVEDYNRLISREFNKLVAGTTRGFEGAKYTEFKAQTTTGTVATVEVNDDTRYKRGDVIYIYDLTASSVKGRFVVISISSNTLTVDTAFAKLANNYMISGASSTITKSNTLLVCDVIGNPTNYPASWKLGTPFFTTLHTAEGGTSLLPDGVRDTFKLSRKANATPLLCLRSTDNGATWTSFTPTFSTTTNEITLTNEPTGNLVMVYYQTKTSMAVPVVNGEVLEIGAKVIGANGYATSNGLANVTNTLIGKTLTNSTQDTTFGFWNEVSFTQLPAIEADTKRLTTSTRDSYLGKHTTLSLYPNQVSPAIKVFPYLTRTNGKAYLNLVFKEMKHNGTSWGDSNKFEIVDNVSTTTDNNAQTVLIGQKTVELPYFIGADE